MSADHIREQAPPTANDKPAVWPMVMDDVRKLNFGVPVVSLLLRDMEQRDADGRAKYGVPLQPGNGRDPLVDAYQEALDLCAYLRQAQAEMVLTGGTYDSALWLALGIRGLLMSRGIR